MEGADEGEGKEVEVEGGRGRRQIEKGDRGREGGGRTEKISHAHTSYRCLLQPTLQQPKESVQ